MKTIYFIRHGESNENAGNIRVGGNATLTPTGTAQVNTLLMRLKKLPLEFIISSTLKRSNETLNIINAELNLPCELNELFIEKKKPSQLIGKSRNEADSIKIDTLLSNNFTQENFRFLDEENFQDLFIRAKKALEYLYTKKEEHILVITHGHFLRVLLASVVFSDKLTAEECKRFLQKFYIENTGISIIKYNSNYPKSPWWIYTWNDTSHIK